MRAKCRTSYTNGAVEHHDFLLHANTPFSPVWRRRSSSASVRILPAPSTFQGASAIPAGPRVNQGGIHSSRRVLLTFLACHGYDVALEVALQDAPRALVDHEWCLVRHPRVHVRLGNDPRRGVGDALHQGRIYSRDCHPRQWTYQVENLSLGYEVVQAIHDFLGATRPVPLQSVYS